MKTARRWKYCGKLENEQCEIFANAYKVYMCIFVLYVVKVFSTIYFFLIIC